MRCGWHLSQRGARTYEASFVRSNTMPKSPFANPSLSKPKPTAGVPFSAHAFNSEAFDAGAEPQQQGTQIDALGHFASIKAPWDPKNPFSADGATYYGGYKQKDVKPSPIRRCSSSASRRSRRWSRPRCCSTRKRHVGKGRAMADGELVTAAHIEAMLKAQGLAKRGILPGDMVWIYTGWSEHWKDPATKAPYYAMAPGLSVDAAKLLATQAHRRDRPRRAVHRRGARTACCRARRRRRRAPSPGCRSRSTTTCCRCSASTTSRT